MKANRSARIGVIAIGTLLLGMASGCGSINSAVTFPEVVSVQVVQQAARPIGDSYLGVVTPFIQTSIAPAISGVLQTVNVRVGDKITPGELLATINTDIYQAQLNQAQAGVAQAQAGQSATEQGTSLNLKNVLASLQAAEAALSQVQAQSDAGIQAAQKAYDTAQTAQSNAVASAQKALATAQTQLQNVQVNYQNSLTGSQNGVDAALAALNAAQVGDQAAQASLSKAQDALDTASTGLDRAKQMVHSLNDPALLAAQAAYDQAAIGNQQAQGGAAQAAAAVKQAQAAYNSALSNQQAAQSSQPVQTAQAQVNQAEQALAAAQSGGGAQVAQAKTALDSAQSNATASIEATKAKVVQAQTAYQTALNNPQLVVNSAQIQAAQANVELAQTTLDKGQVTAPMGGYVVAVNAQVGQAVGPQGGFIVVSSMNPLMVTVDVSDRQVSDLKIGTDMDIHSSSTGKTYPGTVTAIHPSLDAGNAALDNSNSNFPVDIQVNGTPSGLLSGMQVEAHRVDRSQKVMLIPANTVLNLSSGQGDVYVVKVGVAHLVHVKLGDLTNQKSTSGADYSVLSGLRDGDQVVVQGQNQLNEGDKVTLS